MRYAFTNWSESPFTGRYGRVDYPFNPGETKDFDPDKHQMLIIMAKQLADRELQKNIASVGKNPNDLDRYGKALDSQGNPIKFTVGDRKDFMRKAIGELVDTPLPLPADQQPEPEAGTTAETIAQISTLKDQMTHLTEMVQGLAASLAAKASAPAAQVPTPAPQPVSTIEKPKEPVSMETTRAVLMDMAKDSGLETTPDMTKEQLVDLLNN